MRISEYIFELKEEALMDQSKKKIKLLPRPNKIHKSECLLTTSGFMYQEFEHPSYLHAVCIIKRDKNKKPFMLHSNCNTR